MLFGEFLLSQELVQEEDLVAALDEQQQNKMPMGQMAVQKGFMDSKDLFRVLTEQRKRLQDNNDFGQIALEMGLLNERQVGELVESQSSANAKLGSILVEKGVLPQEKLIRVLRDYNVAHTK